MICVKWSKTHQLQINSTNNRNAAVYKILISKIVHIHAKMRVTIHILWIRFESTHCEQKQQGEQKLKSG